MNTTWIILIVLAVLAVKGVLLHGFIKRKMAESEAASGDAANKPESGHGLSDDPAND
jgi:hypothetical protein